MVVAQLLEIQLLILTLEITQEIPRLKSLTHQQLYSPLKHKSVFRPQVKNYVCLPSEDNRSQAETGQGNKYKK